MSWDAYLRSGDGDVLADVNYTHNVNGMIAAAYEAASGHPTEQAGGPLGPAIGAAWWKRLDGTAGDVGAVYLAQIVAGLEADPERFRAMNPENGWGSYDGVLAVLRELRDAPGKFAGASRWSVSG